MKNTQQKNYEDLSKRILAYYRDNKKLLDKHELQSRTVIHFPKRQELPLMIKLVMWVMGKYGAVLDTQFTSTKK
ncbi:MAG: hypothetical protein ABIC19_00585 [Patescibacteria group bacterium]|nr:hypothetical protein [Patescibacteria group bacterium]